MARKDALSSYEKEAAQLEAMGSGEAAAHAAKMKLLRQRAPQGSHLNRAPPPKTTFAAIIMLVGGVTFLISGLYVYFYNVKNSSYQVVFFPHYHSELFPHHHQLTNALFIAFAQAGDRGLSMIVLGSLMFIPGSYASLVLYGSWRGWHGYEYSMIPSYDDTD